MHEVCESLSCVSRTVVRSTRYLEKPRRVRGRGCHLACSSLPPIFPHHPISLHRVIAEIHRGKPPQARHRLLRVRNTCLQFMHPLQDASTAGTTRKPGNPRFRGQGFR